MPADVLQTRDEAGRAMPPAVQIVIQSHPLAVRTALGRLFDTLLLQSLSDEGRGTAEIVLAEALNNIVEHAYASADGEIELTLHMTRAALVCRIVDHGMPMPGEILPEGRLAPLPSEGELPEGGFGWHLIRSLSQDLAYQRCEGRNQLSFCLDMTRSVASSGIVAAGTPPP